MRPARIPPSMGRRRPRALLALAFGALLAGASAAQAQETALTVLLDRAQIMAYPPTTATIIVGNPIIADVTMLRNTGQVILTGKGFGDTNLLFLDGHGAILQEARIRVRESPSVMVVQRGVDRETFACHPRCEPTVALGDSTAFLQRTIGDIQARNAQATGAAAATGGGQH
ncbi:pilus assembly protein N-terminal domain-containing protein [Lichenibacterium ramalinae]|nr:pilus assembly protein N-terminal domain-containing protein [Lichenibacterium ramalinae]